MPKNLTIRQISRLPEGVHRAAPSLYVQVKGGSRLWLMRYSLAGKARTMSLGSIENVTMDEAMAAVAAARLRVRRDRVDVLAERRTQRVHEVASLRAAHAAEVVPLRKSGHTFGEAIDIAVEAEAKAKSWKPNPDATARWTSPIKRYCEKLVNWDVTQISEAAIVEALAPHWETSHVMAVRTVGRCIIVMGHARRLNWITGDNPLVLERIKEKLPRVAKTKAKHHPAMPLPALPAFMRKLEVADTVMAELFRLLILTGVRCNEAAGMRRSEVDIANRTWTIPGGTPKSRLKRWQHGDFRVPMSDGALAILEARMATLGDDVDPLVFPDPKGKPYDADRLTTLLRAHGFVPGMATVHGMRSTLRQFLAEHCEGERVAKELCLAHETREDTEAAYDRGDCLRERRGMMAAWDAYCAGRVSLDTATTAAIVLPLRNVLAVAA